MPTGWQWRQQDQDMFWGDQWRRESHTERVLQKKRNILQSRVQESLLLVKISLQILTGIQDDKIFFKPVAKHAPPKYDSSKPEKLEVTGYFDIDHFERLLDIHRHSANVPVPRQDHVHLQGMSNSEVCCCPVCSMLCEGLWVDGGVTVFRRVSRTGTDKWELQNWTTCWATEYMKDTSCEDFL